MRKRVLIADDSVTMRGLITEAVGRLGDVDAVSAGDGLEAFERLGEGGFDLLITDIGMPVMDGLVLIERIRGDERLRDLPVIIMSAMGSWEERSRASALGVEEYLMKPVQAPQVMAAVKKILDR